MGSVFSGKARCAEDVVCYVEKAREDPSQKESPKPVRALSPYVDVHFQLF